MLLNWCEPSAAQVKELGTIGKSEANSNSRCLISPDGAGG
jgi:hypothetical protein